MCRGVSLKKKKPEVSRNTAIFLECLLGRKKKGGSHLNRMQEEVAPNVPGTPPPGNKWVSSWKDLATVLAAFAVLIVIFVVLSLCGPKTRQEFFMRNPGLRSGHRTESPWSPAPPSPLSSPPSSPPPPRMPAPPSFEESDYPREFSHNAQEIQPRLFLGPQTVAENSDWLRRHKITHILNMGADVERTYPGIEYTYIDIDDAPHEPIAKWFPTVYNFVEKGRSGSNRVLVHCAAGISRSATVVCAYLMRKNGWTLPQTLQFLRARRGCVNPNPGFVAQLQQYERDLRRQEPTNLDL